MKRHIKVLLGVLIAGALGACDKVTGDEPLEMTTPGKLAGEWFVTMKENGTDVGNGYKKIMTFNTADNSANMWIDDARKFRSFKSKVSVDVNAMTFSGQASDNLYQADRKVTVTNGKVFPNGGRSKTGNTVDSIYFEASFSDDPGHKYVISGHMRSGFAEDVY